MNSTSGPSTAEFWSSPATSSTPTTTGRRNWKLVAGAPAESEQLADLEFAWAAVRAVKSNAILLARDGASVGVGMGQVNRVDSCRLAVSRAGERAAAGSVAASDAFFPFADGPEILIDAGIAAIVQPGGSVRDDEVIAARPGRGRHAVPHRCPALLPLRETRTRKRT